MTIPIQDALRALAPKRTAHPIGRYQTAFERSDLLVTATLGTGGDSVVFGLSDGRVLHITNKILTPEIGTRFFDLPILERGAIDSPGNVWVHWFVQPEALTPVSQTAMRQFQRAIEAGWVLVDAHQRQLGIYEGVTRLLDPFAVERAPFWRSPR